MNGKRGATGRDIPSEFSVCRLVSPGFRLLPGFFGWGGDDLASMYASTPLHPSIRIIPSAMLKLTPRPKTQCRDRWSHWGRWPGGIGVLGLLVLVILVRPDVAQGQFGEGSRQTLENRCAVQVVSSDTIEAAIRNQVRQGYDITAAPNQGRLVAGVLLDLAEQRQSRRPAGPPLLIRQAELFPAFLRVTGLTPEEVPPSLRQAKTFDVALVVEYREGRVVDEVEGGPTPSQALSVRATWPEDRPSSYTYEDTASVPHVRIQHQRHTTYRLLGYKDMIAYDEMGGVAIQPTSGALGTLFSMIGMAELKKTRHALAEDGTQVTLAWVDKLFTTKAVATVDPEGRARRGLPEDRPRLVKLKDRIEQELTIQYVSDPPSICPGRYEG